MADARVNPDDRARAPFPFIVGCGRSGTTLMRALLDAHPELAVPFESYFPVWFARHRERYERPDGFATTTFVDDVLAHESFVRWGLDADTVRAEIIAATPATFPDAVRACFAAYARAHGKARYADKTPVFVLEIPLLAEMFPEAVFVHLVRDGRNVALSRGEVAWGNQRFDHQALLWREQVERGRADGRTLGAGRYREVHYEDLVAEPERVARELCEFVRLPFDPVMLEYHQQAAVVLGSQPFPDEHRNLLRPPTQGIRDWTEQLAPADVALFEALAGDTLTSFGYPRSTGGPSPRVRVRAEYARARYRATVSYRRLRGAAWRLAHPSAATGGRRPA